MGSSMMTTKSRAESELIRAVIDEITTLSGNLPLMLDKAAATASNDPELSKRVLAGVAEWKHLGCKLEQLLNLVGLPGTDTGALRELRELIQLHRDSNVFEPLAAAGDPERTRPSGVEIEVAMREAQNFREKIGLEVPIWKSLVTGQQATDSTGRQIDNLQRCQRLAYQSYKYAEKRMGEIGNPPRTDREAHNWLKENGVEGYELPSYENWARYLRTGRNAMRDKKNTPRAERSGGSIVQASDLEDARHA